MAHACFFKVFSYFRRLQPSHQMTYYSGLLLNIPKQQEHSLHSNYPTYKNEYVNISIHIDIHQDARPLHVQLSGAQNPTPISFRKQNCPR